MLFRSRAKSFKLGDIASEYACDVGLTFHNSMDDVIATKRLMQIFIKFYDETGMNVGELTPYVFSCSYYKMRSHLENRIYVYSNIGSFYYNTYFRYWATSDDDVDMDKIDIDRVMNQAAELCECSVKDFRKFTDSASRKGGIKKADSKEKKVGA